MENIDFGEIILGFFINLHKLGGKLHGRVWNSVIIKNMLSYTAITHFFAYMLVWPHCITNLYHQCCATWSFSPPEGVHHEPNMPLQNSGPDFDCNKIICSSMVDLVLYAICLELDTCGTSCTWCLYPTDCHSLLLPGLL